MAERLRLDETLKRVFDVNLQCYEGLSRVTAEYLQALARLWMDTGTSVLGRAVTTSPPIRPSSAPPPPSPVALVLEGQAGQVAEGVVMVENRLSRRVSASVVTSAFSSGAGEEIWPTLHVRPGTIELEPGARTLVQIGAVVDERLETGVRYRGEVTVPGLSDTPIPVVLHRRPSATDEPSAAPAEPETAPTPPRARRRSGAAGKRRRKS